MAETSYKQALKYVLEHEGGYVNNKNDPGGATNYGITQGTYDAFRKRAGLDPDSVRNIDERTVEIIYREQYWKTIRGDDLPRGVDYAVFDYAVNSGPARAVKELQAVVGVKPDGAIGNMTLAAVHAMPPAEIIRQLCERRMKFLQGLRHWKHFKNGWTRRVMGARIGTQEEDIGVIDRATKMAAGMQMSLIAEPPSPAPGKAPPDSESMLRTAQTMFSETSTYGALAPVTMGLGVLSELNGPIAWALAAAIVAAVGLIIYLYVRKRKDQ